MIGRCSSRHITLNRQPNQRNASWIVPSLSFSSLACAAVISSGTRLPTRSLFRTLDTSMMPSSVRERESCTSSCTGRTARGPGVRRHTGTRLAQNYSPTVLQGASRWLEPQFSSSSRCFGHQLNFLHRDIPFPLSLKVEGTGSVGFVPRGPELQGGHKRDSSSGYG